MWRRVALSAVCAAALGPAHAHAGDGAALFAQHCLMCHQSGAVGVAGQFPRLAGRVASIGREPKGRSYLIDVLTYGMTGSIVVDDQSIMGLMPPFAQVSNDDAASILNYVQALDPPLSSVASAAPHAPAAFSAEEFRVGRARPPKTPADVLAERQSLAHAHVIP